MRYTVFRKPAILTNKMGQPQHAPVGRVRAIQQGRLSLRSAYRTDPAKNWGSRATVLEGQSARLVDIVLPEPQDITVYCRGTPLGGVTNTFELWRFDWSAGGIEERLEITGPAVGFVRQFVCQSLRVTGLFNSGGAALDTQMQCFGTLGRPTLQRITQGIGTFTNAAPAQIFAPRYTTGVYLNSSDPDWLAGLGPVTIDWLDVAGSPIPFAPYPVTHFTDRFTPPEANGVSIRITPTVAGPISDAAVVWEGIY